MRSPQHPPVAGLLALTPGAVKAEALHPQGAAAPLGARHTQDKAHPQGGQRVSFAQDSPSFNSEGSQSQANQASWSPYTSFLTPASPPLCTQMQTHNVSHRLQAHTDCALCLTGLMTGQGALPASAHRLSLGDSDSCPPLGRTKREQSPGVSPFSITQHTGLVPLLPSS